MSQALNLRKLADMVQGTTGLSQQPVWLLGTWHGVKDHNTKDAALLPEALEALTADFRSRLWLTYRKDFEPLGPSQLSSDVGWGCTIRSGQMMVAEALSRIKLGRPWARGQAGSGDVDVIVQLFADEHAAPLSLHRICTAGAHAGMVPGRWVGPWMLCKALEKLFSEAQPMGLRAYAACDLQGGAPELNVPAIKALFVAGHAPAAAPPPTPEAEEVLARASGSGSGSGASDCQQPQPAPSAPSAAEALPADCTTGDSCTSWSGDAAAAATAGGGCSERAAGADTDGGQLPAEAPAEGRAAEAREPGVGGSERPPLRDSSSNSSSQEPAGPSGRASASPVLILVPLTLGLDKVNPLYLGQLQRVLTLPQSIGIVGGRPGASLYFIGYQEAAPGKDAQFLYLDPHEAQLSTRPLQLETYFCNHLRLLPAASLDPSLAIGFVCKDPADFDDLCSSLDALAKEHRSAPLMTLAMEARLDPPAGLCDPGGSCDLDSGGEQQLDEWEIVSAPPLVASGKDML